MASPTKTIKSPLSPSRSPSKIMGSPFSTAMATATWPTLVHWLISCDLETLERNFMNILQNIAKVTIQDCDSVVIQGALDI
ncbi:hypothetical protein Tco_0449216 [Tanacetum coccineum]